MFYKAYSIFYGPEALSTNSMQVVELAKECLPVDCIGTLLFYRKTVILLEPQLS